MFSTRGAIVISVVTTSLIYAWSRYHKKKKIDPDLASHKLDITFMGFTSLLCCGTNLFRKRQRSTKKAKAPYKQDTDKANNPSSPGLQEKQSVPSPSESATQQKLVEVEPTQEEVVPSESIPTDSKNSSIREDLIQPLVTPTVLSVSVISEEVISEEPTLVQKVEESEVVEEAVTFDTSVPVVNLQPYLAENQIVESGVSVSKKIVSKNLESPLIKDQSEISEELHFADIGQVSQGFSLAEPKASNIVELIDALSPTTVETKSPLIIPIALIEERKPTIIVNTITAPTVSITKTEEESQPSLAIDIQTSSTDPVYEEEQQPTIIVNTLTAPAVSIPQTKEESQPSLAIDIQTSSTDPVYEEEQQPTIIVNTLTAPAVSIPQTEEESQPSLAIDIQTSFADPVSEEEQQPTIIVNTLTAPTVSIPTHEEESQPTLALDTQTSSTVQSDLDERMPSLTVDNKTSTTVSAPLVEENQQSSIVVNQDSRPREIDFIAAAIEEDALSKSITVLEKQTEITEAKASLSTAKAPITNAAPVCPSKSRKKKNKKVKQTTIDIAPVVEKTVVSLPKKVEVDASGSDVSDEVITPNSASDAENIKSVPVGIFNDPDYDIVEDSPEVIDGKTLPRVLVPSDLWAEAVEKDTWRETFSVPASMGGVLIGRFGKNVRELKTQWNAEFSLNMCPGRQDTLLLKLSCPLEHKDSVLHWFNSRLKMRPSQTTIGNPNQLKRNLPMGETTEVQIRSLYGLKEFFLTIKDDEYTRYLSMQEKLDKDYSTLNSSRMQLYEPVTSGTVAVLPHSYGFARALILKVLLTWPRQALCFLLDHGTFGVVSLSDLRKIKAKYMRVPFQAIHVSWAHAMPIYSDVPDLHILRTFFSNDRTVAFPVRMETCCRASVALLDCQPSLSPESPAYSDMLALACRCGLYVATPVGVFPNRQAWLNRSNTAYYPCPYSDIPYQQLVEYFMEDPLPGSAESQQKPLVPSQSQNKSKRVGSGNRNTRRPHPSQNGNNNNNNRRFRKNNQKQGKKTQAVKN